MLYMKNLLSPANVITVTGGVLTVIGAIAYATGAANLSVPTLFYGFPIFLGGLALKTSELPPVRLIEKNKSLKNKTSKLSEELTKLLRDVTRWRYGQKVHLDTSLKSLKLWDDENPPNLLEIESITTEAGCGVRLQFDLGGVAIEQWEERRERLGRFFAKDLQAELKPLSEKQIDLILLPKQSQTN